MLASSHGVAYPQPWRRVAFVQFVFQPKRLPRPRLRLTPPLLLHLFFFLTETWSQRESEAVCGEFKSEGGEAEK